ncbi:MAG TPA: ABC transporter permease [Terracidiphilus sp.]|nr:ABC transporter permease [Terracidiphilus sp.]
MSLWRQLTYGLRSLLRRSARDRDVADEVEHYFEEASAAGMARGLSRDEAKRDARLEAGSIAAAREQARSYGWENAALALIADLRFAARQLFKHRAFTVAATLTLALGIGANTAIFTVIESVLLAPLPYRNADQIAVLNTRYSNMGLTIPRVTGPDAIDVRDESKRLEAVSLYGGGHLGVQLRGHSAYAVVTLTDADFSRVFQVKPIAGRWFRSDEEQRAAVVREAFARDNFGSPQAALGQTVHVEGDAFEITGVLPDWFDFPAHTQVWEAARFNAASTNRTAFNFRAVARLRPDLTLRAAQTELNEISRRLAIAYPRANRDKLIILEPLQQALTGDIRPTLLLLWATAGLILLIACVNVTHLELVRSLERQREIAIRKALGSSQWQVMRPLILESLLVSILGGAAGVLLAFPTVHVLVAMAPKELPHAGSIHLNGWVLLFTAGLGVLTALASSMLPALKAARVDAAEALKRDTSRGMSGHGAATLRDGLVIAEVTATFVLAMGAGLLLHTMTNLLARNMGYDARQLLVVDADAPAHSTQDALNAVRQFNELFASLAALPGVEHVAGIMGLPTGNYGSNGNYKIEGAPPPSPGHQPSANFSVASPGYFQTMGIPIQRGRDFDSEDTYQNPFVAVISQSLAKQSFGSSNPIGKQIQCGLDSDKWMTVVGVVGDVRQDSPAEAPGPTLYMPMAQHPFYANQINIVLRTHVKPLTLLNPVQKIIRDTNPAIALRFTTMDTMLDQSMAAQRFRAVLISCFAAIGLLLAVLGVYGTMAYSVTQRTFEIGIRMAFGADRSTILRTVLEHAAKLALWGIAAGMVLSLMLARLVTSMLVGVRPMDPVSLASAASLLLLTALAAALAPGWKATHVDPMAALRTE